MNEESKKLLKELKESINSSNNIPLKIDDELYICSIFKEEDITLCIPYLKILSVEESAKIFKKIKYKTLN